MAKNYKNNKNSRKGNSNRKGYSGKDTNKGGDLRTTSSSQLDRAAIRNKIDAHDANDASWYVASQAIAQDATNFSFNNALGAKFPKQWTQGVEYQSFAQYDWDVIPQYALQNGHAVPGIMTLDMVATYGESSDYNSPLNMATRKIAQQMWNANGRNATYDATDIMLYICALDQIYSMWTHCSRALGLLPFYDARNKYMGEALIEACGFDPIDLKRNANDFRLALNVISNKLQSFPIPVDLPIITRHASLYGQIYQDEGIMKTQFYIYKPAGYYIFRQMEVGDEIFGRLEYKSLSQKVHLMNDTVKERDAYLYTTTEWLDILDEMVESLCDDDNLDQIKSDLLRYYGDSKIVLGEIPENVATPIVMSPEMLSQIHNLNFLPINSSWTEKDERKDPKHKCGFRDIVQVENGEFLGYLKSEVRTHRYADHYPTHPNVGDTNHITDYLADRQMLMVDIPTDLPNSEEIFVATRFKQQMIPDLIKPSEDQYSWYYKLDFGSEVVAHMNIFVTYDGVGDKPVPVVKDDCNFKFVWPIMCHWHIFNKAIIVNDDVIGTEAGQIKLSDYIGIVNAQTAIMGLYNQFNMAPLIELFESDQFKSGTKKLKFRGYSSDLTNYTFLDWNDIHNMHHTAMLGLFSVPSN